MLLPHLLITIIICILRGTEQCINIGTSGNCYQIVDTNTTWTEAFDICKRDGGMLISIESAEEQQFIADRMLKINFTVDGLWIGSDKLHPEEQRTWANGKKFTYVNWAEGEPNSPPAVENCAEIRTYDMKWNDLECSRLRGYICENILTLSSGGAEQCIIFSTVGHCYQIVDTETTWTQAFKVCRRDGGMLIIIESAKEQQFIEDQMQKRNFTVDGLWIGSNKLHPEKQRTWTNGKKFSYVNWAEGEPNNSSRVENCAEIYTYDMKWNDVACTHLNGYICENTRTYSVRETIATSLNFAPGASHSQVLIIGVSVGSALVFLVGVLLLYCLIQKRNKHKEKKRVEAYQELHKMEMNKVEHVYDQIADLPET